MEIFYLPCVLFIFYELAKFKDAEYYKQYLHTEVSEIDSKDKDYETFKSLLKLDMFYAFYILIGLFSSQWVLFLAIIILSVIKDKTTSWIKIDALLSLALLVSIIINKFHLHVL